MIGISEQDYNDTVTVLKKMIKQNEHMLNEGSANPYLNGKTDGLKFALECLKPGTWDKYRTAWKDLKKGA